MTSEIPTPVDRADRCNTSRRITFDDVMKEAIIGSNSLISDEERGWKTWQQDCKRIS